jgi:hypothetical protein
VNPWPSSHMTITLPVAPRLPLHKRSNNTHLKTHTQKWGILGLNPGPDVQPNNFNILSCELGLLFKEKLWSTHQITGEVQQKQKGKRKLYKLQETDKLNIINYSPSGKKSQLQVNFNNTRKKKHINFKWGFNFIQTILNYSESKFIPVYNPQNINDKTAAKVINKR